MILVISVQLTGKRYTNEFGTDDVTALLTYSKPDDDPFPPFLLRHLRSPPHSHSLVSLRILILRHEISSWSILFFFLRIFSWYSSLRLRVIENLNFSILCSKSKIIYRFDEKIQRKSSLEKDEIPALSLSLYLPSLWAFFPTSKIRE